jgi:hypothetical protein
VELPALEAIKQDRKLYARAYALQAAEQDPFYGRHVVQKTRQPVRGAESAGDCR